MTKKHQKVLTVIVETDGKFCGDCPSIIHNTNNHYTCFCYWNFTLKFIGKGKQTLRLSECLEEHKDNS